MTRELILRDSNMVAMVLPGATRTREQVRPLFERYLIPDDLRDLRLVLLCTRAVLVKDEAADELLRVALLERQAFEVTLVRADRRVALVFARARRRLGIKRGAVRRRSADQTRRMSYDLPERVA